MTTTEQDLQDFLDSEDNEYGLDSVSAHGFLTATLVGKPIENWLSVFFDGQENDVTDDIKQALSAWRESLLSEINAEKPISLPFELDEEDILDEDSELSSWCVGFVDAMYSDEAHDWFDNEDTEDDVAMLTLPILVFSGVDEDDETLKDLRSDQDLLIQMLGKIEANLTELFLLFHTED